MHPELTRFLAGPYSDHAPSEAAIRSCRGRPMPRLAELYVATRTRNVEDAGTSDAPSLLLSRAGQDLFEVPLEGDTAGLGTGRAAVFRIDVADQALDSEGLELRLLAGGNDAWAPEH